MSNKKSRSVRNHSTAPSRPTQSSRYRMIFIKFIFMGVFLAILGFGMTMYRTYVQPVKPLHAFSTRERSAFTAALKTGSALTESVWLACSDGKPEACQLVQQFLPMFQDSGWKVEGNRVITWKPAHTLQGVHLVVYSSGLSDTVLSAQADMVKNGFLALGIPVQTVRAPDVPQNSIGIYFGPDM